MEVTRLTKTRSWRGDEPILCGVVCLLIALVILLLYFNTLGHQFTNWDDGMIYQNPDVRSLDWKGIGKMFTPRRAATYQPIRILSYAIDYKFWKLDPMGYRITNIIFYILTCIMVFLTLRLLSERLRDRSEPQSHLRVGLFGALLFAAHPVHVEAVTWLAARKEVLQGFFFFFAFYLYLKGREEESRKRILYFGWVFVFILLAILSKPAAVIFPGVVLLYEIAREREKFISFLRTHWVFLGLSVILSIIFGGYLLNVMIESGGLKSFRGGGFWSNLLVSLYSFVYSLKLLIWTINYSAAYTFTIQMPVFCRQNIAFLAIVLCLVGFSLLSLRWTKVIFFSFFFFLLALLPYLNILPISTVLADRYVFIASFSYVFLLGILLDRLFGFRHRKFSEGFFKLLSTVLFLLLFVGYSFMTVERNKVWENSYTLWADAVEKYPGSNTANALMGVVYMDLGMDEKAVLHLEKAVELLSYDYQSRNNLGIVYQRLGMPEKALQELLTAQSLQPNDSTVKINLAVYYQRQKEYRKSEEILKALISTNGKSPQLHYRLGLLYKAMGQYESAMSAFSQSIALAPNVINPYREIGDIYLNHLHDVEKAKRFYTMGIEAAPGARDQVNELRWVIQDLESNR
jgi:tetratricopeptide (TPR) repeat protein